MVTELDTIRAAVSDYALFQRALTDFVATAVSITAVGHSLPAATTRLHQLRLELLERMNHDRRPILRIRFRTRGDRERRT